MAVTDIRPGDETGIREAATILRRGGLVAMPTETVYGLAGDATNDRTVARIFKVKNRPQFNPLIVHVADHAMAETLVIFTELSERLADRFWPGPLTLVLPRRNGSPISRLASAGLDTIAIRIPAHPVARQLLRLCQLPLAAPSANPSGRLSPTEASHVVATIGDQIDLILDGGPCTIGLESTVLDMTGPMPCILRQGGLPQSEIESVIGKIASETLGGPRRSPGMMKSHYAPSVGLRMNAETVDPTEALLAFGPDPLTGAGTTLNLSESSDLTEAAANLFRMLHRLDDARHRCIAVMPIPERGLGIAINDRLRRAVAGDEKASPH
jgi:L-threonylcarbamoyladenylate synthase